MENNLKALLLCIFISSTDKTVHNVLYEQIVFNAKQADLAGADVLKRMFGYGCLVTSQEVNVLLYKSGKNKFFDL